MGSQSYCRGAESLVGKRELEMVKQRVFYVLEKAWAGERNIPVCCCRARIEHFNSGCKESDCREEEEIL